MDQAKWATPELQKWADNTKKACLDALTERLSLIGDTPNVRLAALPTLIHNFPDSGEGMGEQGGLAHTACYTLASALVHENWAAWHRMLQVACGFDPEETMSIRLQEVPEVAQALQNELRGFHERWH